MVRLSLVVRVYEVPSSTGNSTSSTTIPVVEMMNGVRFFPPTLIH